MKTEVIAVAVLIAGLIQAAGAPYLGPRYIPPTGVSPLNNDPGGWQALARQQGSYAEYLRQQSLAAELAAEQRAALQRIYSKDVWRIINGTTNFAGGTNWAQVQGRVVQTLSDGVIFTGTWGPILTIRVTAIPTGQNKFILDYSSQRSSLRKFFIRNIPTTRIIPDFEGIAAIQEKMALYVGNYTITNTDSQDEQIPMFEYGTPCKKIWSPEELAAIKAKAEAPKIEASAKALKYNQDLADKGDPTGLLRMGERYRDGDGVEKDLVKAKSFLQRAADAGSPTAAEELKNLPNEP